MREIKFRAWDKDRKIMINDFLSRVHDTTYELIQSSYDGNLFCGNYMENGDWQEPILMQFTGLLDKSGNPIYEGDIIKIGEMVCSITWQDGGFQMITSEKHGRSPAIQDRVKNWEIIGNIYESPELLNL